MKIDELKLQLLRGDLSDETITAFKKALNRYSKEKRCAYAYTVAAQMLKRHKAYDLSLSLLQTALAEYAETSIDIMRCHWHMAAVYDAQENFTRAHEAYLDAFSALEEEDWPYYETALGNELMRTELHRSGFCYTPDLVHYHMLATSGGKPFDYYFPRNAFYRSLAEIILYCEEKRYVDAEYALINASGAVYGGQGDTIHEMILQRTYPEKMIIPKSALDFLKRCFAVYAQHRHDDEDFEPDDLDEKQA